MKQTVTFTNVEGFSDNGNRGISAFLVGIKNHPELGDRPIVHTSRVEKLEYNSSGEVVVMETKNTIYTRE